LSEFSSKTKEKEKKWQLRVILGCKALLSSMDLQMFHAVDPVFRRPIMIAESRALG
jgi:hypothetical protein